MFEHKVGPLLFQSGWSSTLAAGFSVVNINFGRHRSAIYADEADEGEDYEKQKGHQS